MQISFIIHRIYSHFLQLQSKIQTKYSSYYTVFGFGHSNGLMTVMIQPLLLFSSLIYSVFQEVSIDQNFPNFMWLLNKTLIVSLDTQGGEKNTIYRSGFVFPVSSVCHSSELHKTWTAALTSGKPEWMDTDDINGNTFDAKTRGGTFSNKVSKLKLWFIINNLI